MTGDDSYLCTDPDSPLNFSLVPSLQSIWQSAKYPSETVENTEDKGY